jgi:hypothetical protein
MGFVYIPLTYAPGIIIQGITFWAAGWPDLLEPELWQVGSTPILGQLRVVGRGAILLEDVVTSSGHPIHPQLNYVMQDLHVLLSVDL